MVVEQALPHGVPESLPLDTYSIWQVRVMITRPWLAPFLQIVRAHERTIVCIHEETALEETRRNCAGEAGL
jgi:hypothetical protein